MRSALPARGRREAPARGLQHGHHALLVLGGEPIEELRDEERVVSARRAREPFQRRDDLEPEFALAPVRLPAARAHEELREQRLEFVLAEFERERALEAGDRKILFAARAMGQRRPVGADLVRERGRALPGRQRRGAGAEGPRRGGWYHSVTIMRSIETCREVTR